MPEILKNIDPTILAVIAGVLVIFWPKLKGVLSRFTSSSSEKSLNTQRLESWEQLTELCADIDNVSLQANLKNLPALFILSPEPDKEEES